MADILLLDDSEDLLETFEVIFQRYSYNVRLTKTKNSFLSELKKSKPDLIILDVMIGEDDGREICKDIKTKKETENIPVILISASPKTLESFKDYYADDTIEKPFNLTHFFDKIDRFL